MKINNDDISLDNLIGEYDFHKDLHRLYGKNIYINDSDVEVLKRYL